MDLFDEAKASRALSDDEQKLLVVALERGMDTMRRNHGNLDAVYGDVFRVGRLDGEDDVSWPVGGGSLRFEGMATVRSRRAPTTPAGDVQARPPPRWSS